MLIDETKKILSCNDFELGIDRETFLEYKVSYPSDVKPKAIVFIIPGFGEDTNSGYMDKLRKYVAETFSVVAINVFYHCFYSRPNNGAGIEFDDNDVFVLKDVIERYRIDFSMVKEINREVVLEKLLATDKEITISMTLVPKNNEYQNFGVMQAIDHLNVLKDIRERIEGVNNIPVVCFGSSHGAYIAHMMVKIAPGVIDNIIDNSSYVKPPLTYIIGKETNVNLPEFVLSDNKLKVHCFVQTYWNTNINSPYYFSNDRYMIRNLLNKEHIKKMVQISKNRTKYSFYHSEYDTIAPVEDKISFYEELLENGYDVKMKIFSNENDIDGTFIKNLTHGMNMSLKELIKRELPAIISKYIPAPYIEQQVEYKCDTLNYIFNTKEFVYKCI